MRDNVGADVLVMGGGGFVGHFAAYAKAAGAGQVDYIDTDRKRLEIAEKLYVEAIHRHRGIAAFPTDAVMRAGVTAVVLIAALFGILSGNYGNAEQK